MLISKSVGYQKKRKVGPGKKEVSKSGGIRNASTRYQQSIPRNLHVHVHVCVHAYVISCWASHPMWHAEP